MQYFFVIIIINNTIKELDSLDNKNNIAYLFTEIFIIV